MYHDREKELDRAVGRLSIVSMLASICRYRIIEPLSEHGLNANVRRETIERAKQMAKEVLDALGTIERILFGDG